MAIDSDKLNEFLGKFVTDLGATTAAGNVVIGHNLGLYKALAAAPASADELAAATQTNPRYVAEWLRGQAAGGYVQYDPADDTYSMTEEQAFALTNPDGGVYAPGAFVLALGALKAVPQITEAFRTGAGMGWHEQDEDVFTGCEQFFRPGYIANLVPSWIPALDGVEDKLRSGATVADIGGGLGVDLLGDRVRPGRYLRLPARHGRPAGHGPARPPGAQARRHLAHRRARRRRRRGGQPEPGGPGLLQRLHAAVRAERAVPVRRLRPRRAGRRGRHQAGHHRRRLHPVPPRRRDPVQHRLRGPSLAGPGASPLVGWAVSTSTIRPGGEGMR